MFNSYVCLPEGMTHIDHWSLPNDHAGLVIFGAPKLPKEPPRIALGGNGWNSAGDFDRTDPLGISVSSGQKRLEETNKCRKCETLCEVMS